MKVELYRVYTHDCGFGWWHVGIPYYGVSLGEVVFFDDIKLLYKYLHIQGLPFSKHRINGV